MSKTKAKEEPKQEVGEVKNRIPIGFTAKNDTSPLITFQQFFDFMRILDSMNNLLNFVKQENFNADNIRYYFPEDLVDVEVENEKGEKVMQKSLREDFWVTETLKQEEIQENRTN